jgi:ligand-binding sensor domain-containing protein
MKSAFFSDTLVKVAVSKILFHPEGGVYIATYGAGLWKVTGDTLVQMLAGSADQINDIYDAVLDRKGQLWLGTDHGLWKYNSLPEEDLQHYDREDGLSDMDWLL